MKGHLHLVCGPGHRGTSALKEQSFRAPLHLSKPHSDGNALVVNVVNPTAGLFDGDEIGIRVLVESGAHLVLTTPSAGRVYRARSGRAAVVRQTFRVADGGFLEFYPELFIPQAGSRYTQQTTLEAEAGGQLLFFEWLAPGRVAGGEAFAYEELRWDTDFFSSGMLAARESYTLRPDNDSLASLRLVHPQAHYLGCFLCGLTDFPADAIESLHTGDTRIGWSALPGGGWTVKAICADNLTARKTLAALREILCTALGRTPPALRRF